MSLHLRAKSLIERIKTRHALREDAPVGIFATFDSKAALDTANGNNDIIAIATTDSIDLDDEVVLPGGADFSYILGTNGKGNRKLFVDHEYEIDSCVGSLRSLTPWPSQAAMRGWQLRARLFDGMPYPAAEAVAKIIAQDGIGISIGFIADEYGAPTPDEAKRYPGATSIVRKWRMLEASFTCMPCNVSCQTLAVSGDAKAATDIAAKVDAKTRQIMHLSLPPMELDA
jgi:hypothetical protein